MAVILIGMIFGLVCVAGTLVTADPSMAQMLVVYAVAGNLGCALQFMLVWANSRHNAATPIA